MSINKTAADMAYIYQEPCGCVTAILMASTPDFTRELGRWKRYRPKGTIKLVERQVAIELMNFQYPQGQHKHE